MLIGFAFCASAISKLRCRAAYAEFVVATASLLSAVLSGRAPRWGDARWSAMVVTGAECVIVVLVAVPATASAVFYLAAVLLVACAVEWDLGGAGAGAWSPWVSWSPRRAAPVSQKVRVESGTSPAWSW